MSHPTSDYLPLGHVPRRPPTHTAAAVSRQHTQRAQAGYTLAHGGRQVRIGPVAFWIVVGTLVIMAVWSFATGTYFAFHEDVLTRLIGRQAEMQIRLRRPHRRIARAGRPHRQPAIARPGAVRAEARAPCCNARRRSRAAPARSAARSLTGSIHPPRAAPAADAPPGKPRPSPISDTVIFKAPPEREARLESREAPARPVKLATRGEDAGLEGVLARVARSLDQVERRQTLVLADMEQRFDGKARRMRGVLDDLGVDPKVPCAAIRSAARSCR